MDSNDYLYAGITIQNMAHKGVAVAVFMVFCFVLYNTRNLMKEKFFDFKEATTPTAVKFPTCKLPENLFRNEQMSTIRKPNLTQVVSVLNNTKRNKCIDKVKWNHASDFSYFNIPSFHFCVKSNIHPEKVRQFHYERLVITGNYNIISSFFSFLKRKSEVIIIEIGGYIGQTLRKLIPVTGAKHYVVIEPVPTFYKTLNKNIRTLNFNTSVKTYNFGLSRNHKELVVGVVGDATHMLKKSNLKTTEKVQLVGVLDFFIQLGVGCHRIDLLTINCEGCEFEVLETLISTNLIEKFDFIQFQPHYFAPNIGNFLCRYCSLRQLLARTHELVYDFPLVWEAWKRKH
ncbi:uncharacterized protein LOC133186498 [Saccostrea echinata]|uniref:uncharacterized protein LOC133186498 n=1 Tax=Saccostrea echinata TaxID=191078 RepID=UPI002A7F3441|nr:uncharacterized protein LOC133186498 [Saccostrea echinata]